MHKFILPFLGKELEVFLAHNLSPTKLFDLEETVLNLIEEYSQTLGFGEHNSELERFNNSDLNYPVTLSPILWEYFLTNRNIVRESENKLNPFMLDLRPVDVTNFEEYYALRPAELTVARKQLVELNPATIAAPYMMQQVEKLLQKQGMQNFLLSYHNLHLTRGTDSWEVNFNVPDSEENLTVVINDEAIYMQLAPPRPEEEVTPQNPFASKTPSIFFDAIIVEASTALHAKLIASLAVDIIYEFQFPEFSNKWHSGITLLLPNGEIKQYSPLDN